VLRDLPFCCFALVILNAPLQNKTVFLVFQGLWQNDVTSNQSLCYTIKMGISKRLAAGLCEKNIWVDFSFLQRSKFTAVK